MATISRRIASISLMLTHPLSGEKCRREITLAQGRSSSIIVDAHAKSQTYYRKACSEHTLQTGFSFYPCCHSFPLVKLYVTCYNGHRKNVPGGIFPESSVIFIENNRSTGQSWAVISFWLSRECSLLPRRETQSRQSQTFRSPPFGGKKPPQVRGRSAFIIWYIPVKSQTYYRKACSEHTLQTGFSFYPCFPSFLLVNPYATCYNRHRKNVLNGIFP